MKYLIIIIFSMTLFAKESDLYIKYAKKVSKNHILELKKETISKGSFAVKDLIKVIANEDFPIENRWSAIFYLGQIMGDKSIPYISKLTEHKNWMIRLASLKTLTNLGHKAPIIYGRLLKDKAMIIRYQALDSISKLSIKQLASNVWNMLYDEKNYSLVGNNKKRSDLIKKVIRVTGDLDYQVVKKPMLKMVTSNRYDDVFDDLDYSLEKITKKNSIGKSSRAKKMFWKQSI